MGRAIGVTPPQRRKDLRHAVLHSLVLTALVLVLAGGIAAQTPSGPPPVHPSAHAPSPRLLVVLVIDMFRTDFLDLFAGEFGEGGFKRLMREGSVFRECYYPYAITETGPGHATLATGTTPDRHGIPANEWYDEAQGKMVYALLDEDSQVVGGTTALTPVSPRNLLGSTFSDELRLATRGRGRVFGVAAKDRAAILSTGHGANGAYWYDSKDGVWVTSRYYREALPDYIVDFNRKHPVPQPLAEFPYTAAANRATAELAETIVAMEKLGSEDATDFLFIGFSANDYAGHRGGPYSQELEKMTVETDAILAALLQFLDASVGKGNYWLALSADHGVAPTLDQARDANAARLEAKIIDAKAVKAAAEAALVARWGAAHWLATSQDFYFDRKTLAEKNVRIEDAVRTAGEAASKLPGVWGYTSRYGSSVSDSIVQAYRLSEFPGRSPDMQLVPEPFALPDWVKSGTTHGTPFTYDAQVPLILVGSPFAPGDYFERCSPADLAVTLAAVLRIHPPALATGRVLVEALRKGGPAGRVEALRHPAPAGREP
jgi:predicted AlkP superfamily pyrophosphatase or phosphodiesterase